MALTIQQIRALAPLVQIHPREAYWPMDPMEFIRLARFRHHRGWAADQGYNKVRQQWLTNNQKTSAYYDIPVDFINRYGLWNNGENRRPRDSNCGGEWNVFLQPEGKPTGHTDPTGNIPVFYYQRAVNTARIPESIRRLFDIPIVSYVRVSYWWFMGYNEAPATIDHQGDWEHVTVKVVRNVPVAVHFARHSAPVQYLPISQVRRRNGRIVVYSARGTHASYPRAGNYPLPFGFDDEAAGGGYEWNTWENLLQLKTQPWRDYAGAWGEVGETSETTGPLGPWHKRHIA